MQKRATQRKIQQAHDLKAQGYAVREIAEIMEMSMPRISQYLRGTLNPDPATLPNPEGHTLTYKCALCREPFTSRAKDYPAQCPHCKSARWRTGRLPGDRELPRRKKA